MFLHKINIIWIRSWEFNKSVWNEDRMLVIGTEILLKNSWIYTLGHISENKHTHFHAQTRWISYPEKQNLTRGRRFYRFQCVPAWTCCLYLRSGNRTSCLPNYAKKLIIRWAAIHLILFLKRKYTLICCVRGYDSMNCELRKIMMLWKDVNQVLLSHASYKL